MTDAEHPEKDMRRTTLGRDARLLIAQNLVRLYGEVLNEPLPEELLALIKRLQDETARPRAGEASPERR
jgi:hypothetical protein